MKIVGSGLGAGRRLLSVDRHFDPLSLLLCTWRMDTAGVPVPQVESPALGCLLLL